MVSRVEELNQVSTQVATQLLEEIRHGEYAQADRLPPELELAKRMGVSRTAIRDGLATLEREGFISRRPGLGTLINRHVLQVGIRMDLEEEFLDMVRHAGYEPGVGYVHYEFQPADSRTASFLHVEEGTTLLAVEKTVTADGIPAITCIDYLRADAIVDADYTDEDMQKPIFYLMDHFFEQDVYMDLTEIHAELATGRVAQNLDIPEGSPVLHFDEVGYDFKGNIILYSNEYYREGVLPQTILRKKIE